MKLAQGAKLRIRTLQLRAGLDLGAETRRKIENRIRTMKDVKGLENRSNNNLD